MKLIWEDENGITPSEVIYPVAYGDGHISVKDYRKLEALVHMRRKAEIFSVFLLKIFGRNNMMQLVKHNLLL